MLEDYSRIFRKSQISRELLEGIRKKSIIFFRRCLSLSGEKRNKRLQKVTSKSLAPQGIPLFGAVCPRKRGRKGGDVAVAPPTSPQIFHKLGDFKPETAQKYKNMENFFGISVGKGGVPSPKTLCNGTRKNQSISPGWGSSGTSDWSSAKSFLSSLEDRSSRR